jgi:putative lipoic acid-binding regulatory protein
MLMQTIPTTFEGYLMAQHAIHEPWINADRVKEAIRRPDSASHDEIRLLACEVLRQQSLLEFASLKPAEDSPQDGRLYYHLVFNEQVGQRSWSHHRVLSACADANIDQCVDAVARDWDETGEPELFGKKSSKGYSYDGGDTEITVLKVKQISSSAFEALSSAFMVIRSEDLSSQLQQLDPTSPERQRT